MPARSEAQRRYLYMKFGPKWMAAHGFNNDGPLPQHTRSHKPHHQLAAYLGRKHHK